MSFFFRGALASSKSLMNRCLVVASYEPQLKLLGHSECDDVLKMVDGLRALSEGDSIDCGSAGTVFRFLALRASRMKGDFFLTGSPQLLARPQDELVETLSQLGVRARFSDHGLEIRSQGWRVPSDALHVSRSRSSQFASAVLLNSWDLDAPLRVRWSKSGVDAGLGAESSFLSEGYWVMTLELLRRLGLELNESSSGVNVSSHQRVKSGSYLLEPDLSSAFVLAALAAVAGEAEIEGFANPLAESLQPDKCFVGLLKELGVKLDAQPEQLIVRKSEELKPITADLKDCPDLFPVLAVLCALAPGRSVLHGAPHLIHKESNRIERVFELLKKMGRTVEVTSGGMVIYGSGGRRGGFVYDPAPDHRLAFAAAVARAAGFEVDIRNQAVVGKSFPEFWNLL